MSPRATLTEAATHRTSFFGALAAEIIGKLYDNMIGNTADELLRGAGPELSPLACFPSSDFGALRTLAGP
jgi:hypothetical protein